MGEKVATRWPRWVLKSLVLVGKTLALPGKLLIWIWHLIGAGVTAVSGFLETVGSVGGIAIFMFIIFELWYWVICYPLRYYLLVLRETCDVIKDGVDFPIQAEDVIADGYDDFAKDLCHVSIFHHHYFSFMCKLLVPRIAKFTAENICPFYKTWLNRGSCQRWHSYTYYAQLRLQLVANPVFYPIIHSPDVTITSVAITFGTVGLLALAFGIWVYLHHAHSCFRQSMIENNFFLLFGCNKAQVDKITHLKDSETVLRRRGLKLAVASTLLVGIFITLVVGTVTNDGRSGGRAFDSLFRWLTFVDGHAPTDIQLCTWTCGVPQFGLLITFAFVALWWAILARGFFIPILELALVAAESLRSVLGMFRSAWRFAWRLPRVVKKDL